MIYLIWYDTRSCEYLYGTEEAYKEAVAASEDNAILAEEFVNTSEKLVQKITQKLNQNLTLIK